MYNEVWITLVTNLFIFQRISQMQTGASDSEALGKSLIYFFSMHFLFIFSFKFHSVPKTLISKKNIKWTKETLFPLQYEAKKFPTLYTWLKLLINLWYQLIKFVYGQIVPFFLIWGHSSLKQYYEMTGPWLWNKTMGHVNLNTQFCSWMLPVDNWFYLLPTPPSITPQPPSRTQFISYLFFKTLFNFGRDDIG
jgi:hypothetical protein